MATNSKNTGEDIFHFIQSAFAENEGANRQEEPADVDIPPIEYKGQRVITTDLMAQVYETTPKNIRMNFANHEDNFKEGIHYYLLQGEELQHFKNYANDIGIVGKNAPMLYLNISLILRLWQKNRIIFSKTRIIPTQRLRANLCR